MAGPAAMITNMFARFVYRVEEGARPALLRMRVGDPSVGA